MKYIINFVIIIIFSGSAVQASEIFGSISTDPRTNTVPVTSTSTDPIHGTQPPVAKIQGAVPFYVFTKQAKEAVIVKGVTHYPDGTLLRGPDRRIYLIGGEAKKPIRNLTSLQKYRGRIIIDVTFDDLAQFVNREHLNGELIRVAGTNRIYVIKKGRKEPVKSLAELRTYHNRQEICSITASELYHY
jgi:hypothetical protein